MAIPVYLAMTASEIGNCSTLPGKICWMACHFSPFGKGISNIPRELPGGSILILDDSYPPQGHCPEEIAQQLGAMAGLFPCHGVILDFQRPGCPETARIASRLAQALPCPVAVSALYAGETQGAVLVPPVPLRVPLHKHLAGWSGREIWLELAMDSEEVKLTRKEYDLLLLFARNPNVALYRETIYERVWNEEFPYGSKTVDLHIQRLRKKVGWEKMLKAVNKVGYRLEA